MIPKQLIVLEMANNHWGSVDRGLKLIRDYGSVVRFNNVKAAIKLQFRDVDSFIHQDFRGNEDLGEKFNAGYRYAGRMGAQLFVHIGSDDWVHPDVFDILDQTAPTSEGASA